MAYRVEFSPQALGDADEIVGCIARDSIEYALCWRSRLQEKVDGLTIFPHACSLAPESDERPFEIRQAMFGNYRILFTIREEKKLVYILTIRHGARRVLTSDELNDVE